MKVYRLAWWSFTTVLSCAGVAVASLTLSVSAMVVLFLCIASVVGVWTACIVISDDDTATSRWSKARRVCRTAAAAAWIGVATVGTTVTLGPAALVIPLLLLACSPLAVAFYLRKRGHRSSTSRTDSSTKGPEMPSESLRRMTTAELCLAWVASYDILRTSSAVKARLHAVEQRQMYLDELERRDPDGIHAWLGSNASPGSNPQRFVTGGPEADQHDNQS